MIGMTRAQLETAAADASAKAAAELKALLTPGATVYGSDGTVAATVDSADAQFATVNVGAMKAKLPLNAFTKGAQGVTIGITSAALKAAVDSQASAQATPAAPAGNAAKPR